ncbi:MAG TPA: hypothetical protein VI386_14530 [Candidatus Sulfotelmatobacter sp.]
MSSNPKLAIVAAIEREISSLIKNWRVREQRHSGYTFRFFENENVIAVCGGIGAEPARRAAESVIALYNPAMIYSAGFAGAANSTLRVADVVIPRRVIDARDGSSVDTETGEGILVSSDSPASPQQKTKLHASYQADAVDMEAAAVAKAAQARRVRFRAVKAISDERNFELPPFDKFVRSDGTFLTAKFAGYVIPRPWLWGKVLKLQGNSTVAARALCHKLQQIISETDVEAISSLTDLNVNTRR